MAVYEFNYIANGDPRCRNVSRPTGVIKSLNTEMLKMKKNTRLLKQKDSTNNINTVFIYKNMELFVSILPIFTNVSIPNHYCIIIKTLSVNKYLMNYESKS